MTPSIKLHNSALFSRRNFCATAAVTALGAIAIPNSSAESASPIPDEKTSSLQTGNGEWTYEVVSGWGQLPSGISYGGTHGGIITDKDGNVYISTQSDTGILVYRSNGTFIKTLAKQYPEVHSMFYTQEQSNEYLYATVQKGTPAENWFFVKMKIDGTVVMKITAPPEAGFKAPNEWRITAAVPAPNGDIFIANGYGDSRLFRFDGMGNYKASYSGHGKTDGLMDCSHGLAVDTRYDQPLLLVCDRENRRLCHFDFDGKFVRTVAQHLRRPCQISFLGDYAVVSELEGRAIILDRDNVPVAFLGDNPLKSQWANYTLKPGEIAPVRFSAAHGCHIDKDGNVYVSDWNQTGRVTKLARLAS